ncbi:MAG: hypothetical protein AABY15_06640 [Nanoarchaeota archaeon]
MDREQPINGISIDDVWGKCTDPTQGSMKRLTNGMLVARGLPYEDGTPEAKKIQENSDDVPLPMVCPVWKDRLPYKSVTVICDEKDLGAVLQWLSYVHGGEHSNEKRLPEGKIAIRSDYQCW